MRRGGRDSIAATIEGGQFGAADSQNFIAVDCAQSSHAVRGLLCSLGAVWDQASNDAAVPGDLDFFALVEKAFGLLESVAEVAD